MSKIILHLAIGKEADTPAIEFDTVEQLAEYITNCESIKDKIWLCTGDGVESEIVISEDLWIIRDGVYDCFWWDGEDATLDGMSAVKRDADTINLYLQTYDSFESAYAVALSMREGHPKCYD